LPLSRAWETSWKRKRKKKGERKEEAVIKKEVGPASASPLAVHRPTTAGEKKKEGGREGECQRKKRKKFMGAYLPSLGNPIAGRGKKKEERRKK